MLVQMTHGDFLSVADGKQRYAGAASGWDCVVFDLKTLVEKKSVKYNNV